MVPCFSLQVIAIADQSRPVEDETKKEGEWGGQDVLGHKRAGGIRGAFDSRAVASATLDVMSFILSGEGSRVRILLVKDIVRTFNALMKHYYLDSLELANNPLYAEFVMEERLEADLATTAKTQSKQYEPNSTESSLKKWKVFAWGSYGENVFTNPLSWSKAHLARLWGARQGLWSSNKKNTEHKQVSYSKGPELAGHRAHSQSPGTAQDKHSQYEETSNSKANPRTSNSAQVRMRFISCSDSIFYLVYYIESISSTTFKKEEVKNRVVCDIGFHVVCLNSFIIDEGL